MFDFLKKKISSWITGGKAESKKPKKKEKKTKKAPKKTLPLTKAEKKLGQEAEKIIAEAETPLEKQMPEVQELKSKETAEINEEGGNFFTRLVKKLTSAKLSQEDFDEFFQEFEMTLLENNVALETVDKIRENLSKSLVGLQVKKTEVEARILQALKDSILEVLIEPPDLLKQIKDKTGVFTILFFGINGTGKTTSIAKIAFMLKKKGISCVLAAADTFRAASIEQLKIHGEKVGVPVIASQYGADPASVAFDARKYAESQGIKVVLIDTAGRMYTKENLLKEMEKIVRISKPDLKFFVGESITGNDMILQCKTFDKSIGIDGIILSKSDIDEKGGTILSVSHSTKKPIYYLGVGQSYEDLEVFSKKNILKNLGLE